VSHISPLPTALSFTSQNPPLPHISSPNDLYQEKHPLSRRIQIWSRSASTSQPAFMYIPQLPHPLNLPLARYVYVFVFFFLSQSHIVVSEISCMSQHSVSHYVRLFRLAFAVNQVPITQQSATATSNDYFQTLDTTLLSTTRV